LSGTNVTSTLCTIGPARESGIGLVPYIDGNVAARTPRRMWHAGVEYSLPLSAAGRISVRLDLNGQDDVFERAINGARFGERTLLDARLAYEADGWSIALWGRNLGDAQYVRAASSRGQVYFPSTPRPLDLLFGDPRRIGLTVTVRSGRGS
jgi:iron complex outermembrane receptor protein